jgi:hypothetical protein
MICGSFIWGAVTVEKRKKESKARARDIARAPGYAACLLMVA